jgi:hypothetical protein
MDGTTTLRMNEFILACGEYDFDPSKNMSTLPAVEELNDKWKKRPIRQTSWKTSPRGMI